MKKPFIFVFILLCSFSAYTQTASKSKLGFGIGLMFPSKGVSSTIMFEHQLKKIGKYHLAMEFNGVFGVSPSPNLGFSLNNQGSYQDIIREPHKIRSASAGLKIQRFARLNQSTTIGFGLGLLANYGTIEREVTKISPDPSGFFFSYNLEHTYAKETTLRSLIPFQLYWVKHGEGLKYNLIPYVHLIGKKTKIVGLTFAVSF